MRESVIERHVCAFARQHGWLVRKLVSPGHRGAPDRFFMRYGRIVFIEFKAPGQKPSLLQTREHARYHAHGFFVHVVESVHAGKQILGGAP